VAAGRYFSLTFRMYVGTVDEEHDLYVYKCQGSEEELTRREKQVLKLLIEGRLSKQIRSILKISKQTR
jgi:FixJ family two-component response regulator